MIRLSRFSRRLSLGLLAALSVPAASAASFSFGESRLLSDTIQNPQNVKALDLDGDGDLDVVAFESSYGRVSPVVWWENLGQGQYRRAGELRQTDLAPVRVEDFDGDRLPDLLSAREGEDGRFHYYLSKGLGLAGFAARGPELPFTTVTAFQFRLSFEDVNRDTYTDVLAGNQLWLGQEDGSFTQAPGTPLPEELGSQNFYGVWMDVNGDDLPDYVYIGSDILVSLNQGEAGFSPAQPFLDLQQMPFIISMTPVYLVGVSFDECLLVQERDPSQATQDVFLSLVMKRDGAYRKVATQRIVTAKDFAPLKVSVQADAGNRRILLERLLEPQDASIPPLDRGRVDELTVRAGRTGQISFAIKHLTGLPDTAGSVQFADLTGDGKNDVLYTTHGEDGWGSIQWQPGTGAGRFSKTVRPVSQPVLTTALDAAADLDGDGDTDLVSHLAGSSTIAVWTNNGQGSSFTQNVIFTRGGDSQMVKVLEPRGKGEDPGL